MSIISDQSRDSNELVNDSTVCLFPLRRTCSWGMNTQITLRKRFIWVALEEKFLATVLRSPTFSFLLAPKSKWGTKSILPTASHEMGTLGGAREIAQPHASQTLLRNKVCINQPMERLF